MSSEQAAPGYELVDRGDRWVALRHDPGGPVEVFDWPRHVDPTQPGRLCVLEVLGGAVAARWGRRPVWSPTATGWVAR